MPIREPIVFRYVGLSCVATCLATFLRAAFMDVLAARWRQGRGAARRCVGQRVRSLLGRVRLRRGADHPAGPARRERPSGPGLVLIPVPARCSPSRQSAVTEGIRTWRSQQSEPTAGRRQARRTDSTLSAGQQLAAVRSPQTVGHVNVPHNDTSMHNNNT